MITQKGILGLAILNLAAVSCLRPAQTPSCLHPEPNESLGSPPSRATPLEYDRCARPVPGPFGRSALIGRLAPPLSLHLPAPNRPLRLYVFCCMMCERYYEAVEAIDRAAMQYGADKFDVVLIYPPLFSPHQLHNVIAPRRVVVRHVIDERDWDGAGRSWNAYGVEYIPTLVLMDSDQMVLDYIIQNTRTVLSPAIGRALLLRPPSGGR